MIRIQGLGDWCGRREIGAITARICPTHWGSGIVWKMVFQFIGQVAYTGKLLLSGGTEQLEGGWSLTDARWFEA
jgi:hypothetical protein